MVTLCSLGLGPIVIGRLMVLSTGRLSVELEQVKYRVRLHLCLRVNDRTILIPFLVQ